MNDKIKNIKTEILSNNWYTLKKLTFKYLNNKNIWEKQSREVFDRGNGAVVLLYNMENSTVILTEQFRIPTYVNKNETGMMIEACAGLLDEDNPETAIIREIEEETGYRLNKAKQIFKSYMSPGAVTEILYFFVAPYHANQKVSEGGGAKNETENITVHEYDFSEAIEMMDMGKIKDAKTIMLLQYAQLHIFQNTF